MSWKLYPWLCLALVAIGCGNSTTSPQNSQAARISDWCRRIVNSRDSIIKNDSLYSAEVHSWLSDNAVTANNDLSGKVYYIQAKIYSWTNKDSLAHLYFEKAIPLLSKKERDNALQLLDGYYNLALVDYYKGYLHTCNIQMAKSAYIADKYYDTDSLFQKFAARTYGDYGGINRALENDSIALKYLYKALPLNKMLNKQEPTIRNYAELAAVYVHQQQFEKAESLLQQADSLANAVNKLQYYVYNHFAELYYERKDYNKTIVYLDKEFAIKPVGNSVGYNINYSGAFLGLQQAQNAKPYIDTLLAKYDALTEMEKPLVAVNLAQYFVQTKQTAIAEKYLLQFADAQQAYYSSEKALISEDLAKKYELKEKEDRIQKLNLEKQYISNKLEQRNYLMLVFALLFFALTTTVIAIYLKQKNKKILYESKLRQMEDTLLRSQMEPHFVYNAMSSLQSLIMENRNQESANYLAKFARLLRLSLEHSRKKYVPFSEEKETIDNYLQLQKLRFGDLFNYKIEDNIRSNDEISVPPLMIQPFVENAIYHGFSGIDYTGVLSIRFSIEAEFVQCTITDNGIGFHSKSKHQPAEKSSLSTIITKERLQVLTNQKNISGLVEIGSNLNNERGTMVVLKMPFVVNN
jgi:anti-sigma regulatory factor (Ser/Thr protein kinase)